MSFELVAAAVATQVMADEATEYRSVALSMGLNKPCEANMKSCVTTALP